MKKEFTIGNCFSGDLARFFVSLKTLMAFPMETKIYAGHDYVQEAMKMAASIEQDNPDIEVVTYDDLLSDARRHQRFLRDLWKD